MDASASREVCERVRVAVQREAWAAVSPELAVAVSIGCLHVAGAADACDAAALLARTDRRLYTAKAGGRNRVVAEDC